MQIDASEDAAHHLANRRSAPRGHFKPWALLTTPEFGRAFRFFFPTLLVASFTRAYLYDVVSAQLIQTIQVIQANGPDLIIDINYVELNDDYVFICGSSWLRVFKRSNGQLAYSVPSTSVPAIPAIGLSMSAYKNGLLTSESPKSTLPFRKGESRAIDESPSFVAAHVSGNHLAALLSDCRVLLIKDFIQVADGKKQLSDSALEVCLYDPDSHLGDKISVYLAFEYERVAVVASSGVFVLTLDAARYRLISPPTTRGETKDIFNHSLLTDSPFPELLVSRIYPFDHAPLLSAVTCLQMTETKLFLTYDPETLKRYGKAIVPSLWPHPPADGGEPNDGDGGDHDAFPMPGAWQYALNPSGRDPLNYWTAAAAPQQPGADAEVDEDPDIDLEVLEDGGHPVIEHVGMDPFAQGWDEPDLDEGEEEMDWGDGGDDGYDVDWEDDIDDDEDEDHDYDDDHLQDWELEAQLRSAAVHVDFSPC